MPTSQQQFIKMHGAGNDFVILDARTSPMSAFDTARLADRHVGIGCDQVIVLEPSTTANCRMHILNADGSEVAACGNATRCVGWLMMQECAATTATIETAAGTLRCSRADTDTFTVTATLGAPKLDWKDIPLSQEMDTLSIALPGLTIEGCAVNVGNPHIVLFDGDGSLDIAEVGPMLETHPLFPERTNVEIVRVMAPDYLEMRVWERGAGLTQACGTGACASLVAAVRRGLSPRRATVSMPGGALEIEWQDGSAGGIAMTGPVHHVFTGAFDAEAFA